MCFFNIDEYIYAYAKNNCDADINKYMIYFIRRGLVFKYIILCVILAEEKMFINVGR